MAASEVTKLFAHIRKSIHADDQMRPIIESFKPPATDAEIAKAEKKLGVEFPNELSALFRALNGQDPRAVRKGKFPVGLFPSAEDGDRAFLFVSLDDLAKVTPKSPDDGILGWIMGWIPIGDNRSGYNIVVDLASDSAKKRGRVLQFNHEYSGALPIAASLSKYLRDIADGLESGTIRFDEECGLSRADGVDFDEACGEGQLEGAEVD